MGGRSSSLPPADYIRNIFSGPTRHCLLRAKIAIILTVSQVCRTFTILGQTDHTRHLVTQIWEPAHIIECRQQRSCEVESVSGRILHRNRRDILVTDEKRLFLRTASTAAASARPVIYPIICLKSVCLATFAAFIAQFPREMSQTDRIHPRYFLL